MHNFQTFTPVDSDTESGFIIHSIRSGQVNAKNYFAELLSMLIDPLQIRHKVEKKVSLVYFYSLKCLTSLNKWYCSGIKLDIFFILQW